MKWWQILAILLIGVVLLLLLFTLVPGGDSIKNTLVRAGEWLINALAFGIVLFMQFLGVFVIALFFRGVVISSLDDRLDSSRAMSAWGHLTIASVFCVVAGVVQLLIFLFFLDHSPQFYSLLSLVNGVGPFETPPIGWVVYGIVAFLIGYVDWSTV